MNEIDRAELIQSVKAYFIPSGMFIACLLGAAGTFLLQEGYMVGWGFIMASGLLIALAFFSFCTFQNKLRARGKMKDQFDTPAPDFESVERQELSVSSDKNEDSERVAPDALLKN